MVLLEITVRNRVSSENILAGTLLDEVIPGEYRATIFFQN
jgi:hypothetical protein